MLQPKSLTQTELVDLPWVVISATVDVSVKRFIGKMLSISFAYAAAVAAAYSCHRLFL